MRLCFLRAGLFVWGLVSTNFATTAFAQFTDQPDPVEEDSLAAVAPVRSTLVAKSPYVVVPVKDQEIADRLSQLSGCLELRPTPAVKSYVRHYAYRPEKTRKMLGRQAMYFHIFEQKLREHGVPDDLKFLAVVESALNPTAVSRVGASGLWQFMPATGTEYGMEINTAVDERNNVIKSSDAAARYLKALYKDYNDWALVLAAYNSGPNRVNSAIRRSGSRDFWTLQRFLPKETRNYVPAFIAATYICTYFGEHSIEPEYPELDAQLTDYMAVYEGMSFSAIADATGLSYQTVANLNPGFKRSYVPPSTKGYYVTLPRRVMPAFIRYLNSLGGRQYKLDAGEYTPTGALGDGRYFQTTVTVKEVDFVERFAAKNNLSAAQVRAWNKLPNNFVYPDQQLKIWNPVLVQKHSKERIEAPAPKVKKVDNFTEAPAKPSEVKATKPSGAGDAAKPPVAKQKEYQWHTVGRNESLSDVARRYGVSTDALMLLNNTADVKAGMRLKIKELK